MSDIIDINTGEPVPASPQLTAELHRISSKIDSTTSTPKAKLKAPKLRRAAPDDTILTAPIHHMTVAQARQFSTIKRTRKGDRYYTPDVANSILQLMAEGMMLVEICEMDDMPCMSTVWRWRQENPSFDAKLSRAREALGDQFAQAVRDVADNSSTESAACDRVKMDAYRWLAAKMYPKQYGDRSVQELTGSVVVEQRHVIDATKLSPEAVDALEDALRAAQALPMPEQG